MDGNTTFENNFADFEGGEEGSKLKAHMLQMRVL